MFVKKYLHDVRVRFWPELSSLSSSFNTESKVGFGCDHPFLQTDRQTVFVRRELSMVRF